MALRIFICGKTCDSGQHVVEINNNSSNYRIVSSINVIVSMVASLYNVYGKMVFLHFILGCARRVLRFVGKTLNK